MTGKEVLERLRETCVVLKLRNEEAVLRWVLNEMLPEQLEHLWDSAPKCCDICAAILPGPRPRARYCGAACRKAAQRARPGQGCGCDNRNR